VAADIGPLGQFLDPLGDLEYEDAVDLFAEQAAAAEKHGADLVIIETMSDLAELSAAVEAARRETDLPVFATMTFTETGFTFLGVSPEAAVRAATRGGALAQGRPDCGLVKEGFRADLVMLDADGVSWHPTHNALRNVVYAGHGSDVLLTMCDGRVVYREGTWPGMDVERIKAEVDARAKRIVDSL